MLGDRRPVVIVTGASKGIGLAVTKILLEELGANVVAISRTRSQELKDLVHKHSSNLLSVNCSVTDSARLKEVIGLAVKVYQHIDGLVLNAGTLDPLGRIESADLESWKAHFDVNFFSLVPAVQVALPYLRKSDKGGKVVFVSSGSAVKGTPAWGAYNASKAAMNSLCRTLAEEEPDIVSVALRPGMVDTPMQAVIRSTGAAHMSETDHEMFVRVHAEGKLVKPEDSGSVIAALALHADKSLSGQFVSWDSDQCKPYRKQ